MNPSLSPFLARNQSATRRRAQPGRSGFSLLEVVVILAIITLVIGAGVLSVNHLRRDAALRVPARKLSEAVARASWLAREEQQPVQLAFTAEGLEVATSSSTDAAGGIVPAVAGTLASGTPPLDGTGGEPAAARLRVDPVDFSAFDQVSLRLPGAADWVSLGKQPVFIELNPLAFSPDFSIRLESAELGWVEQDFHSLSGELAEERSSTQRTRN